MNDVTIIIVMIYTSVIVEQSLIYYICLQKSQKNEVFVDLLERLTAVVAANVSHVMLGDVR